MLPMLGEESAVEQALYCRNCGSRATSASSTGRTSPSRSAVGRERAIPAIPTTSTSAAARSSASAVGRPTNSRPVQPRRANCSSASTLPVKSSP